MKYCFRGTLNDLTTDSLVIFSEDFELQHTQLDLISTNEPYKGIIYSVVLTTVN